MNKSFKLKELIIYLNYALYEEGESFLEVPGCSFCEEYNREDNDCDMEDDCPFKAVFGGCNESNSHWRNTVDIVHNIIENKLPPSLS